MPKYPLALNRKNNVSSDVPGSFGQRIRALRKRQRLTLEEMSAASGISRAALSKIERSEMSPTYETLLKLARGLGSDLALLVTGREPAGGGFDLTRSGEGVEYWVEGFVHRLLASKLSQRTLLAFVTEVRITKLEKYGPWHKHDSEDFLYVLDGAVEVHLSDHPPIELRRGDSLQMDGRISHAIVALPSKGKKTAGKSLARLLWISVPFS